MTSSPWWNVMLILYISNYSPMLSQCHKEYLWPTDTLMYGHRPSWWSYTPSFRAAEAPDHSIIRGTQSLSCCQCHTLSPIPLHPIAFPPVFFHSPSTIEVEEKDPSCSDLTHNRRMSLHKLQPLHESVTYHTDLVLVALLIGGVANGFCIGVPTPFPTTTVRYKQVHIYIITAQELPVSTWTP